MVALKHLALLAGVASVMAAPQVNNKRGVIVTEDDVVWTTVMVTVTAGAEPTPTPQAAQPPPQAQVTTTPAAQPVAAAASSAPAASSVAASAGQSGGYMDIVNEWRGKMGLALLTQDSTLQANDQKTCDDSGGQLNHELNPGSMAQVLAPGTMADFEKIFVGGWLCEMPSLPGLDGICSTMSQGWSYDGQTGHAEILSSTSYTKIGCAASEGVVGCDLA